MIQAVSVPLGDTTHFGLFSKRLDAACNCPRDYRIVKVEATVSEVEEGEPS